MNQPQTQHQQPIAPPQSDQQKTLLIFAAGLTKPIEIDPKSIRPCTTKDIQRWSTLGCSNPERHYIAPWRHGVITFFLCEERAKTKRFCADTNGGQRSAGYAVLTQTETGPEWSVFTNFKDANDHMNKTP
jgi:hypothetical protein